MSEPRGPAVELPDQYSPDHGRATDNYATRQAAGRPRVSRRRNPVAVIGIVIAILALAAGTFWAGTVVGRGQSVPDAVEDDPVFVTVTEQSVGRKYTLGVVVTQERLPIAQNLLAGVLTSVAGEGEVGVGDAIYAVDGVPVRVIVGDQPFFRDLSAEMRGADVQALNDALVQLGYLTESGDYYSGWTTEAVKQWQRDTGVEVTGMIPRGTLLAVRSLPASLTVDTASTPVGSVLGGGESLVLAPSAAPEFTMPVTPIQEQAIPLGATVEVTFASDVWRATVAGSEKDEHGTSYLLLAGEDGRSVCGDQCAALPQSESLTLMGAVQVVPETTGPAVPVAALQVQPTGQAEVSVRAPSTQSGAESVGAEARLVEILASQDGIAIVEGVQVGEEVLLFAAGPVTGSGGVVAPATSQSGN